jgi:hypothetical protein
MKTRKLVDLIVVVLVALCIATQPTNGQTLEEIFESVLDQAIISPLPDAIGPLVSAAETADTNEIAAVEIAVANRERMIRGIYLLAPRDLQFKLGRQKKACAEIKSELIRIKNQRTVRKQKAMGAREGGRWNLFHGRFHVSPAPDDYYSSDYEIWLLDDGFIDIRGDDPPGPISAVVTLASTGYEADYVPARDCTLTIRGDQDSWYDNYPHILLHIDNLTYKMDSFEIAPGVWTGINTAVLNPFGSPPVGVFDIAYSDSGQLGIRLEGMFTNDLYSRTTPILFFASIFGGVPREGTSGWGDFTEEAMAAADAPMIVPLIGRAVEQGLPKLMGAHVLEFSARGMLTLLENTTLKPNADIAMVRYNDGSYEFNPRVDEALGSHVVIEPLSYIGESPPGAFNFSDAPIRIIKGRNPILTGFLRNPVLDAGNGGFFADLEITTVSGSSTVLAQIGRNDGTKAMQIAVGAVAYDLVMLTDGFRIPGRMPWPEVFHLGANNHVPVADAGPDQTVYAWINGIAEVILNGSGSYDDDGQPLTYLWNWTVDGEEYDANSVNPTIELPVGEHIIELTVNDGIEDSEPNQVVITVIEQVESQLWVFPRVINRHSKQPTILALVRLAEGVTRDQIDSDQVLMLYPGPIEAIRQHITQYGGSGAEQTRIVAFFDKTELMDAVGDNGSVELQLTGQFKTGQYFCGTGTVRIINSRDGNRSYKD